MKRLAAHRQRVSPSVISTSTSGYSFKAAFAPHAGEIVADSANYTDIEPSTQVGKVKV